MASPARLPGVTLSPSHRPPVTPAGAELGGWAGYRWRPQAAGYRPRGGRERGVATQQPQSRSGTSTEACDTRVAGHTRVAHLAHTRARPNSAAWRVGALPGTSRCPAHSLSGGPSILGDRTRDKYDQVSLKMNFIQ
eukprot:6212746-Pleurochrysis_carterae.AAC.4